MSAVAFRGFVSGMPPFICGVLFSLLVYAWTGPASVSIARPPASNNEVYLGRKIDSLTSTLATTEQKLEQERRLVQHLKRELRDASLQIDVYSRLRRASGERADPIWPSTAVAATEETSVLAPYVVGARSLVGVKAVDLLDRTATSARKSPYSPRKFRKAGRSSRASKIRKVRSVRRARPVVLSAPKRVVASVPAVRGTSRDATGAAHKQIKRRVGEAAIAAEKQAGSPVQNTARTGSAKPRRARKPRTRVVRRLARPSRLGRVSRRQRYSARRRTRVVRPRGSFFSRVARRGVFGDAYTVH